ncbi:hypothetical protein QT982_33120, partial [Microcoleus sp. herbarium2]
MTIETINDVLFPPFLFTTLFCLASAFLHEPEAVQSEELTNNRTEVNAGGTHLIEHCSSVVSIFL